MIRVRRICAAATVSSHALTKRLKIRLVWKAKMSIVKALFLSARFFALLAVIIDMYRELFFLRRVVAKTCDICAVLFGSNSDEVSWVWQAPVLMPIHLCLPPQGCQTTLLAMAEVLAAVFCIGEGA